MSPSKCVKYNGHEECAQGSSIPPGVTGDLVGTLKLGLCKCSFFVHYCEKSVAKSTIVSLKFWGHDQTINLRPTQIALMKKPLESEEISIRTKDLRNDSVVEYPLRGNLQGIKSYVSDMGMLALDILNPTCLCETLGNAFLSLQMPKCSILQSSCAATLGNGASSFNIPILNSSSLVIGKIEGFFQFSIFQMQENDFTNVPQRVQEVVNSTNGPDNILQNEMTSTNASQPQNINQSYRSSSSSLERVGHSTNSSGNRHQILTCKQEEKQEEELLSNILMSGLQLEKDLEESLENFRYSGKGEDFYGSHLVSNMSCSNSSSAELLSNTKFTTEDNQTTMKLFDQLEKSQNLDKLGPKQSTYSSSENISKSSTETNENATNKIGCLVQNEMDLAESKSRFKQNIYSGQASHNMIRDKHSDKYMELRNVTPPTQWAHIEAQSVSNLIVPFDDFEENMKGDKAQLRISYGIEIDSLQEPQVRCAEHKLGVNNEEMKTCTKTMLFREDMIKNELNLITIPIVDLIWHPIIPKKIPILATEKAFFPAVVFEIWVSLKMYKPQKKSHIESNNDNEILIGTVKIPLLKPKFKVKQSNSLPSLPRIIANDWYDIINPKDSKSVGKMFVILATGVLRQIRPFTSVLDSVRKIQSFFRQKRMHSNLETIKYTSKHIRYIKCQNNILRDLGNCVKDEAQKLSKLNQVSSTEDEIHNERIRMKSMDHSYNSEQKHLSHVSKSPPESKLSEKSPMTIKRLNMKGKERTSCEKQNDINRAWKMTIHVGKIKGFHELLTLGFDINNSMGKKGGVLLSFAIFDDENLNRNQNIVKEFQSQKLFFQSKLILVQNCSVGVSFDVNEEIMIHETPQIIDYLSTSKLVFNLWFVSNSSSSFQSLLKGGQITSCKQIKLPVNSFKICYAELKLRGLLSNKKICGGQIPWQINIARSKKVKMGFLDVHIERIEEMNRDDRSKGDLFYFSSSSSFCSSFGASFSQSSNSTSSILSSVCPSKEEYLVHTNSLTSVNWNSKKESILDIQSTSKRRNQWKHSKATTPPREISFVTEKRYPIMSFMNTEKHHAYNVNISDLSSKVKQQNMKNSTYLEVTDTGVEKLPSLVASLDAVNSRLISMHTDSNKKNELKKKEASESISNQESYQHNLKTNEGILMLIPEKMPSKKVLVPTEEEKSNINGVINLPYNHDDDHINDPIPPKAATYESDVRNHSVGDSNDSLFKDLSATHNSVLEIQKCESENSKSHKLSIDVGDTEMFDSFISPSIDHEAKEESKLSEDLNTIPTTCTRNDEGNLTTKSYTLKKDTNCISLANTTNAKLQTKSPTGIGEASMLSESTYKSFDCVDEVHSIKISPKNEVPLKCKEIEEISTISFSLSPSTKNRWKQTFRWNEIKDKNDFETPHSNKMCLDGREKECRSFMLDESKRIAFVQGGYSQNGCIQSASCSDDDY